MKVSIVIRAYNEEKHIGRLMDGIEHQQFDGEIEVILVDSGSTDSTVSIAEHMGAKIVRIEKSEFTFGRALNIGCKAASGDILLFASAHVYPVYNDWITRIVKQFEPSDVACVYGRQIGNDITRYSEHQVFNKWFPSESNTLQKTPFCNNANCAVRRELWEKYPYDEALTGLEDLHWANHILGKGFHLSYEAEATIVHVHEETDAKVRNRYMREAMAMKDILPEVHFGKTDFLRMVIYNVTNDFLHAIKDGVFFRECMGIWRFRFNQFYGTYLGHNQKGGMTADLKNRFYYPKGLRKSSFEKAALRREDMIDYD